MINLWKGLVRDGEKKRFEIRDNNCLYFEDQICVPKISELRKSTLDEAHSSPYFMHLAALKRDITDYVSRCFTCQQVKAEHQFSSGLVHPTSIPEWKWDKITMDFVIGLPLTPKRKDTIWVIVDKLTKSVHFLPVRTDFTMEQYVELYIDEIDTKDKVRIIRDRLKAASDCQKSYANLKRRDIDYAVGDKVFLKVSPWKKRKLSPRFIGPYEIIEHVGTYRSDPLHVISVESVTIESNLTYEEEPVRILAREIKELRNKRIPLVKVLWTNHKTKEATWESEDIMRQQHPQLLTSSEF
ncbi:uncharacterized protein LOC110010929 [Jatropha curcas]|uniref:uncharacterized protein LOC110010929 n=1 Tax=Jatropha curcas TaxID=180498 RepID=UPI0018936C11|nr:uncharacterized protein LOC110010929 [Jatropha curcas]